MSSLEKMLINTPNFGHKWQLLWPHNIRPWVWCSPISFCDLPSVLLDYMALSFRTYKLDGHSGNLSEWLGVLQSWKIRSKEKKPPVVAIGTQHLQTPLLLSFRDWHLSLLAMYCVLHVNLAQTSFGYHLHETWCCHRKTKTHTLHCWWSDISSSIPCTYKLRCHICQFQLWHCTKFQYWFASHNIF